MRELIERPRGVEMVVKTGGRNMDGCASDRRPGRRCRIAIAIMRTWTRQQDWRGRSYAGLVVKACPAASDPHDRGEFAIPINTFQAHASASPRTVLPSRAIYDIRDRRDHFTAFAGASHARECDIRRHRNEIVAETATVD